jgi:hypothetical protein
MHHELKLHDEFKMQEKIGGGNATVKAPELFEYKVKAKSGMFKNGRQYEKGEKIMLVKKAADNLLAAGDIDYITGNDYDISN